MRSRERIAADLEAMALLYEIGNLCATSTSKLEECLDAILNAAIRITRADRGNIQLLDAASNSLNIVAQRGLSAGFLNFFAHVHEDDAAACGAAMTKGERIVVRDVSHDPLFTGKPARDVLLAEGISAVQSTPIVTSSGQVIGMISTHFSSPSEPGERELRQLDLVARQAAAYLERKRAAEHEKLLMREMNHRAKNLLTVVQSVVELTRADNIESFVAKVTGRVAALGRAHSLTAQTRWEGSDLRCLLVDELAAFRAETIRISLDGPPAILHPTASQALALVAHELATNAVKYGSLSNRDGCLAVTWQLGADGLTFTWAESGGAIVRPPARAGFGTRVLHAAIEQQLKGRVTLEWQSEGLRVVCWIPPLYVGRSSLSGRSGAAPNANLLSAL
jgi:two-component sensor histidine kinase